MPLWLMLPSGRIFLCIFSGLLLLLGCSSLENKSQQARAGQLAGAANWQALTLNTSAFTLRAYLSPKKTLDGLLTIYIEGDGSSWIHGEYPSYDPTPKDPVGLRLAYAQPEGAVAYLGRPCQYVGLENPQLCNSKVWTSERFSQAVITATNQAVDELKARAHAQRINLVGYSGGAAVALLVAAQRSDVAQMIFVAGNVNPHVWVKSMGLQPLVDSLDTRKVISLVFAIPQTYLVGGRDVVLAPELTYQFIDQFPRGYRPKVIEVRENSHTCCWVDQWPVLWKKIMRNEVDPH